MMINVQIEQLKEMKLLKREADDLLSKDELFSWFGFSQQTLHEKKLINDLLFFFFSFYPHCKSKHAQTLAFNLMKLRR
jgi:hypothetical protein